MTPGEVRDRLLADHADLRRRLSRVRGELEAGNANAAKGELLELLDVLVQHVDREDALLPQVILEDFAFGVDRLASLFAHHREQRDEITAWRARLNEGDAVDKVLDAVEDVLVADMRSEERELLNDEAIRDDIVQVAFGG